MMMQYKVGDRVKIREDLVRGETCVAEGAPEYVYVTEAMWLKRGTFATIERVQGALYYIEGCADGFVGSIFIPLRNPVSKEEIRQELALLKQLSSNIEVINRARERRRRRMAALGRTEDAAGSKLFAAFDEENDRVSDMEARYIAASAHFDATDRTILLESMMGHKTYRELGKELGYSVESIRKRAKSIVARLTEIL